MYNCIQFEDKGHINESACASAVFTQLRRSWRLLSSTAVSSGHVLGVVSMIVKRWWDPVV